MKRIDRLLLRQRTVLVVALGAVLLVFGTWITSRARSGGGWFGYSPNTHVTYYPGGAMRPGLAVLVHIGLVVVWAAASLRLLRSGGDDRSPKQHPDERPPSAE